MQLHGTYQYKCLSQQIDVTDIHSAKIFTNQRTVRENSELTLRCSTFGSTKDTLAYFYLCKDGLGIIKKRVKQDQADAMFTISRVSLNDSGNYSCVYSTHDHPLTSVTKEGVKAIQILVVGEDLHSPGNIVSE